MARSLTDRILARAVQSRLASLSRGRLILEDAGERYELGARSEAFPIEATLRVHDPAFYAACAFRGSIGAGESYMAGHWSTDDLTALVRILCLNRDTLDGLEKGLAKLAAPVFKLFHFLRENSKSGSRSNIAAHYDLGNELFSQFLDPTMMYSAAWFEREDMTLEEASIAKIDRICRKLDLRPSDHLLEIGTGWGALAIHAAQQYGCRVTTTTLSEEQFELARERVRVAGLEGRVTVLRRDYRDLEGRYDKIVSIEMIEAVGYRYYDTYFEQCSRLLKADGALLLQAIIIADQQYEKAKRSVDFIQRYIFPGSCIPSISAITSSVARKTDLRLFHLEDLTPHYARTLRQWRKSFLANEERIAALGYPIEFRRMWEFYLCYCEGGFEERVIGDVQMLLTKPLNRMEPIFGELPDRRTPALARFRS